jgi:hypothetical protein
MTNEDKSIFTTARVTGIWYLFLALFGILGMLWLQPKVFTGDPTKTYQAITDHLILARWRLVFELWIIIAQALTAAWFYKLFYPIHSWAAWLVAAWGMVNAVIISVSAISMAGAIEISQALRILEDDKIKLIYLFETVSANAWSVGGLFFGLWLLPMGYVILVSKRMPVWLGRLLWIGGLGYILQTFLKSMAITGTVVDLIVLPASIAEFWIVGYLLIYGIRPER